MLEQFFDVQVVIDGPTSTSTNGKASDIDDDDIEADLAPHKSSLLQ